MARKFYVTNAIPYVNAPPHLGHALEFVQTDAIARYHRLRGEDVYYLSGADENALKNVLAAEKAGVAVKDFVDGNTTKLEGLKEALNLSYDQFIKTSDKEAHWPGAQKLWIECKKSGDIYEKDYEGLYCIGCEEFKTEKDLLEGCCKEHKVKPERIKERNYFFRLSKYQDKLQNLVESDQLKIVPESRKNEVLSFIRSGLEDFSISRSVKRARGWGIPVPGDSSQVIYVWFDALANYITALGYGQENLKIQNSKFKIYWPADVHVVGKGITRFHAIYWPAMLLSAGLELPKSIFVHGYLTVEGQKISKSLGNVVDPYELTEKYGTDAVRYYLLRAIPPTGDGDFSIKHFEEVYNADLANGLGNSIARVAKLGERSNREFNVNINDPRSPAKFITSSGMASLLDDYKFNEALALIWRKISNLDKYVDETKPWKLREDKLKEVLEYPVGEIGEIALLLEPFLPQTAQKIQAQFRGPKIKSGAPLFPRIQSRI
jgi:methionyl-tRNA synthetase